MPDQAEQRPPTPPPPRPPDAGHIPITEELDRAKWTLPPAKMVLIGIVVFAVIAGVFLMVWKHKDVPAGTGGVTDVYAVDVSNGVLVSIQFSARNTTEQMLIVKELAAKVTVGGKEYTDPSAASPSDFARYEAAFPDLKAHVTTGVTRERRVKPGEELAGTAIFAFDGVDKKTFDTRTGLKLYITFFDFPRAMMMEEKQVK